MHYARASHLPNQGVLYTTEILPLHSIDPYRDLWNSLRYRCSSDIMCSPVCYHWNTWSIYLELSNHILIIILRFGSSNMTTDAPPLVTNSPCVHFHILSSWVISCGSESGHLKLELHGGKFLNLSNLEFKCLKKNTKTEKMMYFFKCGNFQI
jgi:hypothetical protein